MPQVNQPYDVSCPTCKRGVNEGCRTSGPESRGRPVYKPHTSRVRKSAKLAREGKPNPELEAHNHEHAVTAGKSVELRLAEVTAAAEALGYAVTWWHPDEVGQGSVDELKDRAVSAGNEYLAYVNGHD